MKLYADYLLTSPYVLSVLVALEEKALPYTLEWINLEQSEQNAPDYAKTSLNQKVPLLVDAGFCLSESSAITEYLAETHPHGVKLYPIDSKEKARVRQVQAWIRSDFSSLKEERSTETFFYGTATAPLSHNAEKEAHKLLDAASQLLTTGQPFIASTWSVADVDLAVMLQRLMMSGGAAAQLVPAYLQEYAKQQWSRPSVQTWLRLDRP